MKLKGGFYKSSYISFFVILYHVDLVPHFHHTHRFHTRQAYLPRSQGRPQGGTDQIVEPLLGFLRPLPDPSMLPALPHLVPAYLYSQPFKIAILLFQLWLYVENYKGALLLSDLAKQKLVAFGIEEHVKKM